jgi:hypothetical protein
MNGKRKLERMKNLDTKNQERKSGIKTESEKYKINKKEAGMMFSPLFLQP